MQLTRKLGRRWRKRGPMTAAVAITVGVLTITGCSTTQNEAEQKSATPNAGVEYARQQIDLARAVPQFTLEAPAFDMDKIRGKTIFNIPASSAVAYIAAVDAEAKKIAEQYGAKWIEYENQGTPTEYATGIDQAISQKADLIILAQTIDAKLLIGPLTRAKAAGIPVLSTHDNQIGVGLDPQVEGLIAAVQNVDFNKAARLSADYGINHTDGDLHALIISTPELPQAEGMAAALADEVTTHCDGCTTKTVNVPITEWSTKLTQTVQSALQADPKINYVLPLWDSTGPYINTAITSAGRTGTVGVSGFGGTPSILAMVQDETFTADVGLDVVWEAYATMDQAGRILAGVPPIESGDEQSGMRLFDKANIDETGTPPVAGKGFGEAYIAGYTKLWSGS